MKNVILSGLCLFIIFFTSCISQNSQSPANKKPKVVIKLMHPWVSENDGNTIAFNKCLKAARKKFKNIQIDTNSTSIEYQHKLRTLLSSNEVPDIFMSWGSGFSKPFIENNKVLQLDAYLDAETKSQLVKNSLNNFTYNGGVYALPTSIAIGVLYCNKELFENNNISYPEDYDQLLNVITAFNTKNITPFLLGQKDRWPGICYYDILAVRQGGINLCQNALNNQASFQDVSFTEAAKKFQNLVQMKAFNSDAIGLSWDETVSNFTQGKSAMLFNGTWVSAVCENKDSLVKGKITAKKFPIIKGGIGKDNEFLGGSIDGLMISSNTKHKTECVNLIKFLTKSMAEESYIRGSGIPSWKVNNINTDKINPLIVEQNNMVNDESEFISWWDVYLGGSKSETHLNLIEDLFTLKITPNSYSENMQKINLY